MNFFLFSQGFDICVSSSTALGQWGEILSIGTFLFSESVKKRMLILIVIHEDLKYYLKLLNIQGLAICFLLMTRGGG